MNGDDAAPVFPPEAEPPLRTETEAVETQSVDTVDSVDREALDSIEVDLADVEHALARLDDGTYGTCEECGRSFGDDELESEPALRRCPEHSLVAESAAAESAVDGVD